MSEATAPRLFAGVDAIEAATLAELRDGRFLADVFRGVGLTYDSRRLYGEDNAFMLSPDDAEDRTNMRVGKTGLWQVPAQLAAAFVALADQRIATVLEVGVWAGWTHVLLAAYLRRFNPSLATYALDIADHFTCYEAARQRLPITFERATSAAWRRGPVDLCFIDADHSYAGVSSDFRNVGATARICMFHDIRDDYCPGVEAFWSELKAEYGTRSRIAEFVQHSEGRRVMGIGLLFLRS